MVWSAPMRTCTCGFADAAQPLVLRGIHADHRGVFGQSITLEHRDAVLGKGVEDVDADRRAAAGDMHTRMQISRQVIALRIALGELLVEAIEHHWRDR